MSTSSSIRFTVTYRIVGSDSEAAEKAKVICLEQTVEIPDDLVPDGFIRDEVIGRVEGFTKSSGDAFDAIISYPVDAAGSDLPQLLNVIFGNTSIKPGIRVERFDLPDAMLALFRGPRFGREGLRRLTGAYDRPLICAPLKPLGSSMEQLAGMAYKLALGGVDIIKDDHGLADQPYAPFRERVDRCAEAIEHANHETGHRTLYAPNISGPADRIVERARYAKDNGATALLMAPGLVGFDTVRMIADDDTIGLPILSHPAFLGSFVVSRESGVSHFALLGQLMRLIGADAVVYPNFGGRFSFTRDECISIVDATSAPMGNIASSFPCPGGGLEIDTISALKEVYSNEAIFLIGGSLFRISDDLTSNVLALRALIEKHFGEIHRQE